MRNSEDIDDGDDKLLNLAEYLSKRRDVIVDKWGEFGDMAAIGDDLSVFVITTHAAIEEASSRIIAKHVIDDAFTEDAYSYVYSQMSQGHREQLLVECGIFGDSITGDLGNFRGLRNKIVHEPKAFIQWMEDDVEERLDIAVGVLNRLIDALYEEELIRKAVNGEGL